MSKINETGVPQPYKIMLRDTFKRLIANLYGLYWMIRWRR